MKKGDIINGYTILEDFKVTGGMSMVSFAERGGIEYFIKEFLSPKYPTPDSPGSERIKAQKRAACEEFEKHQRDLNNAIGRSVAGMGGSLIYALDFFRSGASYYKVTEKIDVTSLSPKEISKLPINKILLIAKSAAHSIGILHKDKIVHGDLKPDNLLIKEARAGYVTKLIDFDDSYFEGEPPKDRESLVGTPEYYSPEQAEYITDEDDEVDGSRLTCKSDIFTFGIILTEYFTGSKPLMPEEYGSLWSCVKDKEDFNFVSPLNAKIEKLIRSMLSLNPVDRPCIDEVLNELKNVDVKESPTETVIKPGGSLRGMGVKITKPVEEPKPHSSLRGHGLDIAKK